MFCIIFIMERIIALFYYVCTLYTSYYVYSSVYLDENISVLNAPFWADNKINELS